MLSITVVLVPWYLASAMPEVSETVADALLLMTGGVSGAAALAKFTSTDAVLTAVVATLPLKSCALTTRISELPDAVAAVRVALGTVRRTCPALMSEACSV